MSSDLVDLIYLDPPFNSKRNYNLLFKQKDGNKAASQIQAFTDTWEWNAGTTLVYDELIERGDRISDVMRAFFTFLGRSDMMAYLVMMAPRLMELHRVLKSTGSLYLHCDPTASHYLKMLLDVVFGAENLHNEIIWCYRKWSVAQKQFVSNHDDIFFYSKSKDTTFNTLYSPVSAGTMKRWKGKKQQAVFTEGVRQATSLEGEESKTPMADWWDISVINPAAKERLGYPTQKPIALLERIILASSNEGDVVLDPFCGCGTTIAAADKLKRRWIGIDLSSRAIELTKQRIGPVLNSVT